MTRISRWLGNIWPTVRRGPTEVRRPGPDDDAVAERSADANFLARDGAAALATGSLAAAEAAFVRALELRHDLPAAHHGMGQLWLRRERFEEAADELQLAVLFDPRLVDARAELALALAKQGMGSAARDSASAVIEQGGCSAQGWVACAQAFKALDEFERAADCYELAHRLKPGSPDILCQMGYMRFLHGAYERAREAYQAALAQDANHLASLHNLGLLELEMGYPKEALADFRRAAALSTRVETAACIGHALRDLGELDEACDTYTQVLAEHPNFGDARINYAYALLMRGAYEAGWEQYESRFDATGTPPRDFGLPVWQGEPLDGRRLLIFAEQGLGDEIMFASCVPNAAAAGAQCVIECNTRLTQLFARSFPKAQIHGGEKSDNSAWLSRISRCDFQVAIGSLPKFFRPSAASFAGGQPYLAADQRRAHEWSRRLRQDDRIHIGISWRGGMLRSRGRQRSFSLESWAGLLNLSCCRFVALQYGNCTQEIEHVRASQGVDIEDLSNVCADIDELAAVVDSLDLIVTVDNTLAHLSGAMGQKVWVLLPPVPEWRYPRSGALMPWYSSMRLYRRGSESDARQPVQDMRSDLLAELPRSIRP